MSLTYDEASDVMFALVKTTVDASAVFSYTPVVYYPGAEEPESPPVDKAWLRVARLNANESQQTLSNGSVRAFETNGILTVQVFGPVDANGYRQASALAVEIRDAFRQNTAGVWFRNATKREVPKSDPSFHQSQAVAEYTYSENQ